MRKKKSNKQRRRKRTEAENDIFTSFTLNRDPENSKYLPYDEVVYPKLFNRPREAQQLHPLETVPPVPGKSDNTRGLDLVAAAELDSMWVVGFVENARRHQKDLLLRELRDFVRLPGSTVLPGAHAALATISQMEKPTSFNSSKAASSSSSLRAPAAGTGKSNDHGRDSDHDRGGEADGGVDPCSKSSPAARKEAPGGGKSALTELERLRLRELEKRLSQASLGITDADVHQRAGLRAYGAANHKLRKILRGARPPALDPAVRSQGLEAVFKRNREELSAAIRVQRAYKRHYRRKRFTQLIRQLRGVVRIQALARGVLARRFVAEWYARRSVMVLAWQTVIRRMLSNIRWRRRLSKERWAASKLQAAARGRAGRERTRRLKQDLAATRIQCLWRGSVDRARVDKLWLGTLATRIQGLARVLVAKRVVGRIRRIHNAAARSIQRCFRGTVARGVMVRLIWERSMAQRLNFLRALAAEEEWERENMEIAQRRSRRKGLEEKLEAAVAVEAATHEAVFELEVVSYFVEPSVFCYRD